jgi:DNA invertase Pin-like site-specific DNA recombinase
MANHDGQIEAVAYLRTSSAANVGADKDSDRRQRAAIEGFAHVHGYRVVAEFYDAAVSGADPVAERPGFKALLDRLAGNGVRTILVESPDRFARDLVVQLTGHSFLKTLGVTLIPTTAPDYFTEETPTAVLIRSVLGAVAQFEKASLVAKLKAARDRKRAAGTKCGGRKSHIELQPDVVEQARQLRQKKGASLRAISAALAKRGHLGRSGKPFTARSIGKMLACGAPG